MINGFELPIAELYFSGLIEWLDEVQILLVVGSLVFEERRGDVFRRLPRNILAEAQHDVERIVGRLVEAETRHGIQNTIRPPNFAIAAHAAMNTARPVMQAMTLISHSGAFTRR